MVSIILSFIITGLVVTGLLFLALQFFSSSITKSVGKDREQISEEIRLLDVAIKTAVAELTEMLPLDDLKAVEAQILEKQKELEIENTKLKKLEGDLGVSQGKVDAQEGKHNDLKKGKEDAQQAAVEMKSLYESVLAETKQLESQLNIAKTELEAIEAQPGLTADQKSAIRGIDASLKKLQQQLKDMNEVYEQASQRFFNLHTQHSELEKEYRKLVDKELGGA